MTVQIDGLNLEKLLCETQNAGIRLHAVRRCAQRSLSAQIPAVMYARLKALCDRFGWKITEVKSDIFLSAFRFIRKRSTLFAGAAICAALIALSSEIILMLDIEGAGQHGDQVRAFLEKQGAGVGRFKRGVSFDSLREGLLLHLPDMRQVELRFAGSVLEVKCHPAREGEILLHRQGEGGDLIAAKDGVVTGLTVISGTPAVRIGEAVRSGQVLIRGEEPSEQGGTISVPAQGMVTARVWAQGAAKAGLYQEEAKETGRTRARMTLLTPWHAHVIRDAQPFETQNVIIRTEKIVDLFIPLLRRTELYEEITVTKKRRTQADAYSMAQGAAEKLAKKQLPANALILDKWTNYSTSDNEHIQATVILEYETDIAIRKKLDITE